MNKIIHTQRLYLRILAADDALFVQKLLNSPGWLRFIGDRHIHTEEDALGYIERIQKAPLITYWVAILQETSKPIGFVTLIKRDYLEHFDIGFAFLPEYAGKGYAYEATEGIISMLRSDPAYHKLFAVLLPSNERSIRLLSRLGFTYAHEVEVTGEKLHVYTN